MDMDCLGWLVALVASTPWTWNRCLVFRSWITACLPLWFSPGWIPMLLLEHWTDRLPCLPLLLPTSHSGLSCCHNGSAALLLPALDNGCPAPGLRHLGDNWMGAASARLPWFWIPAPGSHGSGLGSYAGRLLPDAAAAVPMPCLLDCHSLRLA